MSESRDKGARPRMDLDGTWKFRMDPKDIGEKESWHSAGVPFADEITVPGAWQAQGFGEPDGIVRHNYLGTAWYRKTVAMPAEWTGKDVRLKIAGLHRRANVFVNGEPMGSHDSFYAPAEIDISRAVRPGEENMIAIRIENPPPTNDYRAAPDTQGPGLPTGVFSAIAYWGGIYGAVELEASDPTRIESFYITSDSAKMEVRFQIEAKGDATHARVAIPGFDPVTAKLVDTKADITVSVPGARLWSPDNPYLYQAAISLLQNGAEVDRIEEKVGIRTISAQGKKLLLNGKPFYLRGYGDDNVEMLSGFPSTDPDVIRRRLRLAKSYGFNGVRFHSMTPPKAYFDAADEVGLFVMAELPVAYSQYLPGNEDFLRHDLKNVLTAYRNRASLLSLAIGNEINEIWVWWFKRVSKQQAIGAFLREMYETAKSIAPQTLFLANDGQDLRPSDMVSLAAPRYAEDVPTISHEFGEYYCSLPDISQIDRYTGPIEPTWLTERKAWVEAQGIEATYPTYVKNSQKLLKLGHKFQIERVRKNPGITGYHYWLIADWPGGTGEGDSWEEGWFDSFWQPKCDTPQDGQEVNSPVLFLVDTGLDTRTFATHGGKAVQLSVSNYGDEDMCNTPVRWKLMAEDTSVVDSGTLTAHAAIGHIASVGEIVLTARPSEKAQKLTLVVEAEVADKHYANRWVFWAFPIDGLIKESPIPVVFSGRWFMWSAWVYAASRYAFFTVNEGKMPPDALLITTVMDDDVAQFLQSGGSVWLTACRDEEYKKMERSRLLPAFGSSQGTIVRDHPALRDLAHEGFCDHQFQRIIDEGWYWPLDDWPGEFEPIIGGVRPRVGWLSKKKELTRFGFLFEAKVGKGKLLATTLNLFHDDTHAEATFLFDRLLRYAVSPEFDPKSQIAIAHLDPFISAREAWKQ